MSPGKGQGKATPQGSPLKGREVILEAQARGLLATHARTAEALETAIGEIHSLANRLERHEPGSRTVVHVRGVVVRLIRLVDDLRAERGE